MTLHPSGDRAPQDRVFVGFGLGAIQSGLFLYEAQHSGAFGRLVVAEVMPEVVAALRAAGGRFRVNIAHASGIEQAEVGPIEVYDPGDAADRAALVEALADADEIATAVPSVRFYVNGSPGSVHRLLAAGLARKAERGGPYAVVYTAENHNHAAEVLSEAIAAALDESAEGHAERAAEARADVFARAAIVNTVIGKMSGIHPSGEGLATVTPGSDRAFLVEGFNRILIGAVQFGDGYAGFRRGLSIFEEKPDLLPFEEAKLYGHNALHALAGYLGHEAGVRYMADLVELPGLMDFVRAAVLGEAGPALIRRHAALHDPLFTEAGFAAYVDDLLVRMVNPWLHDPVERVCRDPARKLGWDDRLVGTMRLALEAGIKPERFAVGVAAALETLEPAAARQPEAALRSIWARPEADSATVATLLRQIAAGQAHLATWRTRGFADLYPLNSSRI